MKTSELIGPALDWAVAKCEGISVGNAKQSHGFIETAWDKVTKWENACEIYTPSTNWSQGGPIIERERITIDPFDAFPNWCATIWGHQYRVYGPTFLIAAMRCYIASKLGDEVEVPKELV